MDYSRAIAVLVEETETLRRELEAANARNDELVHRVKNEFQVVLAYYAAKQRVAEQKNFCTPCINHMWSIIKLHNALETPPLPVSAKLTAKINATVHTPSL
jgi:two-component sensor histidine kinase